MKPTSAVTMLDVTDIHAGYGGSEVLSGLTFSIKSGEIVSLLGRNGMGKTTTLRTIMGLVRPASGSIRLNGELISHLDTFQIARRGIAYVPQGREIFAALTVEENLRLGALRGGKFEEAFELFPALKAKAHAPGGSLSGGQQQQLAIARALLTKPRLLLLDEPSEGIQPSIVKDIALIVARIARDLNIAILLVEQNTDLALSIADRALFIETGMIAGDIQSQAVTSAILQQHMGL